MIDTAVLKLKKSYSNSSNDTHSSIFLKEQISFYISGNCAHYKGLYGLQCFSFPCRDYTQFKNTVLCIIKQQKCRANSQAGNHGAIILSISDTQEAGSTVYAVTQCHLPTQIAIKGQVSSPVKVYFKSAPFLQLICLSESIT